MAGTQYIEIPSWLRRHVDTWIKIPRVKAVVLFGSRATGCAREGSDWDLAIIHDGSEMEDVPRGRDFDEQPVDLAYLQLEKYLCKAHHVGTLAHELATHGKLITGHLPPLDGRGLEVSEEEIVRHVYFASRNLALAIGDVHSDISRAGPEDSLDSIRAYVSSPSSANGAERTVKTLCIHLGLTNSHRHNLKVLAEFVPNDWQARVLAMDGDTSKARLAAYAGSFECVSDTLRRVSASVSLLSVLLLTCCEQLSIGQLQELNTLVVSDWATVSVFSYLETDRTHPSIVNLAQEMEEVFTTLKQHVVERERSIGLDES